METTRDRLLKYIKYKQLTKSQFYAQTGLSNGFLDKTINPGSDKLDKILRAYPKINLYWLVTGAGDMEVNYDMEGKTAPIAAPITAPIDYNYDINERLEHLENLVALVDPKHIEQVATNIAAKVAAKVASLNTWHEKSRNNPANGKH